MKLKDQKSTREQPAEDNYLARIVAITNLGTQPGFEYQGQLTKPAAKMEVTYELVSSNMSDGRPFWVSEELPVSKGSKKLQQRYLAYGVSMDSDVDALINKPVMVTVRHSEKGYANVGNVAGVPGGIPVPELRNPSYLFDPWDESCDVNKFESFPEFKQSNIKRAIDYKDSELFKKLAMESDM